MNTVSPHKSVRFDDAIRTQNGADNESQFNPSEERKSSKRSHGKRSQSSDKRGETDSEQEIEYDDEDESDEEDGESEDEIMDHELQSKIEKIKKNLKDTNSSGSQL